MEELCTPTPRALGFKPRQQPRCTVDAGNVPDWCVIVGEPGTGKSAIKQALSA